MRQTSTAPSGPRTVVLHELPSPDAPQAPGTLPVPGREQVVFVTNAVRRRGGLRSRAEHHRAPVLAAVVR